MATTDYWSSADLKAVAHKGLINEDVMQKIWDISSVPLPFSDMIGSDTVKNAYTEWTEDKLGAPDLANAKVDGQDLTLLDAKGGARVGNHCQISTKGVAVTQRAQSSDTIGRADELAYQLMMRQRELRRDVEAIALTGQGSVADDGVSVAGKSGGFAAWLVGNGNTSQGAAATGGGFANGTVAARVPGTKRALTETLVRDTAQAVWEDGGNPTVLMSVPTVIRRLSEYMFTSSARIATLTAETKQEGPAKAMGSVNVFLTDFGVTLDLVPNRIQQPTSAGVADAFVIDPAYARLGYLEGYRTEEIAKVGLADKRAMNVDWTLKVLNREAHGGILDIDTALAVTA